TFAPQYIRLYGVLQAIYAQEDSIVFLHKSINLSWSNPANTSSWTQLRELRNAICGHPAGRSGAVARITIKSQKLLVMGHNRSKPKGETVTIDLKSLVAEFTCEAESFLKSIDHTLRAAIR